MIFSQQKHILMLDDMTDVLNMTKQQALESKPTETLQMKTTLKTIFV